MVLVNVLESQIVRRVALQRQQVEALQRSQVQRADAVMRATQGGDAAAAMHAEPLQEMFSEAANLSSSTRMMDQDIERLRHADIRSWKSDEEQTRRYVLQLREDWVREIIKQRADARAEEHAERLAHPSTGDPRALHGCSMATRISRGHGRTVPHRCSSERSPSVDRAGASRLGGQRKCTRARTSEMDGAQANCNHGAVGAKASQSATTRGG